MTNLDINFGGLKLRNPLIAASGPITGSAELVKVLYEAGIGAVVTKTSLLKEEYEEWVGRKDIFPYKPVYKYQSFRNGRLLSLPTLSPVPVTLMAKEIEKMKKTGVVVIGSVGAITKKGYRESARILQDAGADALEVNFCCTIPTSSPFFGVKVNFNPKLFADIFSGVKRSVSIPVGIKATVSLYLYEKIIEGLIRLKIKNAYPDFLTLVGQLDLNPGVDLETLMPQIPHISTFGWQGDLSGLTYSALATFSSTLGIRNPMLSASGGLRSYKEVITSLAMGATTAQIHTAILDKGPEVIARMLRDLTSYLNEHGIDDINDVIGKASRDYIPAILLGSFMRERDNLFGTVIARVESNQCNGCSLCQKVCTEGAITMENELASVIKDKCRACNLCILKCPRQAISLTNPGELDALIASYKRSGAAISFRSFMGKEKITLVDKLKLPGKLREWQLG